MSGPETEPGGEDESLGIAYDHALGRRLLGYARPYLHWVVLAVVLLVSTSRGR